MQKQNKSSHQIYSYLQFKDWLSSADWVYKEFSRCKKTEN